MKVLCTPISYLNGSTSLYAFIMYTLPYLPPFQPDSIHVHGARPPTPLLHVPPRTFCIHLHRHRAVLGESQSSIWSIYPSTTLCLSLVLAWRAVLSHIAPSCGYDNFRLTLLLYDYCSTAFRLPLLPVSKNRLSGTLYFYSRFGVRTAAAYRDVASRFGRLRLE